MIWKTNGRLAGTRRAVTNRELIIPAQHCRLLPPHNSQSQRSGGFIKGDPNKSPEPTIPIRALDTVEASRISGVSSAETAHNSSHAASALAWNGSPSATRVSIKAASATPRAGVIPIRRKRSKPRPSRHWANALVTLSTCSSGRCARPVLELGRCRRCRKCAGAAESAHQAFLVFQFAARQRGLRD